MNYEQISSQDSEKTLERIPSMEYEDLEIDETQKILKNIKKSEDKELALQEIKFKKENKECLTKRNRK